MATIHRTGHLEHGDMGPSCRHILVRGSEEQGDVNIRIIDFDHADEHECERKMSLRLGDWEPTPGAFGCDELFDIAWLIGAWTPCMHFLLIMFVFTLMIQHSEVTLHGI